MSDDVFSHNTTHFYEKELYSTALDNFLALGIIPASILYKSIEGRYRPVSYPDWPITAPYRFIKNAYWDVTCNFRENVTFRGDKNVN